MPKKCQPEKREHAKQVAEKLVRGGMDPERAARVGVAASVKKFKR